MARVRHLHSKTSDLHSKESYTLKRALYTPKRALYTLKRALRCICAMSGIVVTGIWFDWSSDTTIAAPLIFFMAHMHLRALSSVYRALLGVYRALLSV